MVNEQQIVLAAEITTQASDFSQLGPMIENALDELEQAGSDDRPSVVVADAQYWNEQHMDHLTGEHGLQVLIPPDGGKRDGERPGLDRRALLVHARGAADRARQRALPKTQTAIEPVFGHTKHNRKIYRFNYRGRSLVRTEWRLVMLTHNLQKLHRHQIATALG